MTIDSMPVPPLAPPSSLSIHAPVAPPPDSRILLTRRKMLFWDRIKIVVILLAVLGFSVAKQHSDIPIMSWGDALREQLEAKRSIFFVIAIELTRQLHYFLSERCGSYTSGGRRTSGAVAKRSQHDVNPWTRYRSSGYQVRIPLRRRRVHLGGIWGVTPLQAVIEARPPLGQALRPDARHASAAVHGLHHRLGHSSVRRHLLVHVARRHGDLHAV
jgi:hypothetical protein